MAWIDNLFKRMTEIKAADLHMTSEHVPRIRDAGDLVEMPGMPKLSRDQVQQIFAEITPERNKKQFEETNDTDFAYALEGVARFRCNLFMDRFGPGGVFRRIPEKILSAAELGLPPAVLKLTEYKKGLVLVTGPTGSGKSTTLAAMIDHINSNRHEHIITIEDPVEFVHPAKKCLINQREIHVHTKSFAASLRAALREDPDIVLVGEMRDLETTRIAIETAETGHLVFGTLHTSTASSTVDRIINQFSADEQEQIRMMLAGSLRGVVAQNLLKKKGGGRVAALEILMVTPGVAANIREGKTYQIPSAMQIGGKYGMQLLNDTLEKLVKSDQVDPMIAYDKSLDKEDMAKKLKALGHDVEAQLFANEKAAAAAAAAPAPGTPKSEPKLQAMGGDQKPKPPLAQPNLGGHPPGHTEPPKPGGPPSGWKK
jgi:twitching motility protein PilT